MTRPFEGVKILDFTQVLAEVLCVSHQLALLGADVIKIERRGGEDMRRTPAFPRMGRPQPCASLSGRERQQTQPDARSVRSPEALAIVKKLVAQVDVVMENFRPGVMDKLGIGYEALSAKSIRG